MKCRWTSSHLHHHVALSLAALLTAVAAACGQFSSPGDASVGPATRLSTSENGQRTDPDTLVGDELGRLRAVTARFQDIAVADDAGYSIPLTGCMSDPALGGMGFHFGKGSAIEKVTPDPLEPEVLVYEPQANGRLRLVAVEFVVPFSLQPKDGPAPRLFGRDFVPVDAFELWALHAWIWRENPAGMFTDFNPSVTCDAVPAASRQSHMSH